MGEALLAGMVIFAGSTLQRTVGFGFSLLSLPVLVMTSPAVLPQALLLLAIPLVLVMVIEGWRDVDLAGLGVVVPFQVLGSWGAARLLTTMPADTIRTLFGVATVLAAGMLALGGGLPIRQWSQSLCGLLSGVMGTGAGLAGPPLALLYAKADGPRLRSTLAASFLVSDAVGLLTFAVDAELRSEHLAFAAQMLVPLAAGIMLGKWTQKRVAGRTLRRAVLAVAFAGGLAVTLMSMHWGE